jgi:hypothetical protein
VRKIEVFSKRLSVQKSPKGAARLSVQKSPKGAAGIAQVRKIKVFSKRLFVQKSPQGAAGIIGAQNRSLFQKNSQCKSRLRVQPEQHNKYVKIEVVPKRLRVEVAYGRGRINEGAQPYHTNYGYIHTARASYITLAQPSG